MIGHTIGNVIAMKDPIKIGETWRIVRDLMDRFAGSQRFWFYSMICLCGDGRVNADASQKTTVYRHLIVVILLYHYSDVVSQQKGPRLKKITHKLILTERYLLAGRTEPESFILLQTMKCADKRSSIAIEGHGWILKIVSKGINFISCISIRS
jgi:hypothetical protein